ncbi:flagellar biosynthesis anti-sigma factor FlgM [Larsenimonas salina]|uniref:flagellar biosynthesis anti-sigma factor FlgM n=1 Tax=Larsenimonas salina TaxID=1295565 RepID=UPI00207313C1|nr:flagellar biosynthesis anti-sigma factor FlgM [Larsenimonas salina]
MKITTNYTANTQAADAKANVRKAAEPETVKTGAPESSARWQPSSAADTSHDIDTARVDAIKEAIRDGRFEVDASKIADGLISSAQELLSEK